MATRRMLFALNGIFIFICLISYASGLAVMSVDLGSEFMKIAIVKPGVPMEIAINSESRRKTPVIVAMRDGERTFGDSALSTAVKYPDKAFWYMQDLVGKTADNPMVKLFQERFPYYTFEQDPDTMMPVFKYKDGITYTVEELLAMILEQAKSIATAFAEQPVTDAVITVPSYFNQAERRAVMRAAQMVDLNVLQLMNDATAVALNYGVFRRKNFNVTESYYMFYDMGASGTTATLVGYQLTKVKNSVTGISETHPQLSIKGIGYDRTLGGMEFNLRLRDFLADAFNRQKHTETDVRTNNRAMGKLYKEANRVRHVLSANLDHMSQVEGLLEDHDFRVKVTRADLEGLCEDLYERIAKPVEDALKMSEITRDEINEVILFGGGTRMPRVREELQTVVKRTELGQGINTDEAAALGAVYQAAHLGKGFRVKKFIIKEATLYPIQVEFEKVHTNTDDTLPARVVKRTLFGRGNPYPQKKVMTFNKHVKDFDFEVNYGDLDFLSDDLHRGAFGIQKLQKIAMTDVETHYLKHGQDSESKGVKAHFRMDESGILHLEKAEAVYEKEPIVEEGADKEESTLEKLGSFFFGSDQKEDAEGDVDGDKTAAAGSEATDGEPKLKPIDDEQEKNKDASTEKEDSKEDLKEEEAKEEVVEGKKADESDAKEEDITEKKPKKKKVPTATLR